MIVKVGYTKNLGVGLQHFPNNGEDGEGEHKAGQDTALVEAPRGRHLPCYAVAAPKDVCGFATIETDEKAEYSLGVLEE